MDRFVVVLVLAVVLSACGSEQAAEPQQEAAAPIEAGRPATVLASEAHVVGLYEGAYPEGVTHGHQHHPQGSASVRVERMDAPVVLVLSSYEPIKWQLDVHPDTTLERVVLCGYHRQELADVPEGIEVTEHTYKSGERPHFGAGYRTDTAQYATFARFFEEEFETKVASFRSRYAYEGGPVLVVGEAR